MKFDEFDARGRTLGVFIKGDILGMFAGTLFIADVVFVLTWFITFNPIAVMTNFVLSLVSFPIGIIFILIVRISDIKFMKKYKSIKEVQ